MEKNKKRLLHGWVATSFFLMFIFFCLEGCGIRATSNIDQQELMSDDEGILVTKVRTNINNSSVLIHRKGDKWPVANLDDIQGPEDLRVIKIRGGEAYFSKLFRDKGFMWCPVSYFTIQPNAITYVGDLVTEWVYEEGGVRANILLIDREAETVAEAKKRYPFIFEKYPYRKSVCGNK
ncbi:MAG TPA: hypothetical protein VN328_03780 [Thermodesulfovibrionales bacterium]|nr:hypothetical protein [Thermodesulfovibrionales bacterium]